MQGLLPVNELKGLLNNWHFTFTNTTLRQNYHLKLTHLPGVKLETANPCLSLGCNRLSCGCWLQFYFLSGFW